MNEAARAVAALKDRRLTLATAESCTGGLLGKLVTDAAACAAALALLEQELEKL